MQQIQCHGSIFTEGEWDLLYVQKLCPRFGKGLEGRNVGKNSLLGSITTDSTNITQNLTIRQHSPACGSKVASENIVFSAGLHDGCNTLFARRTEELFSLICKGLMPPFSMVFSLQVAVERLEPNPTDFE